MWPKLLAQYLPQLIELLPHVSRVVPAADKYLANRGATDARLDTLSTSLTADLGKVARAHVDMARQLDTFAAEVTAIGTEARAAATESRLARTAVENLESRLTRAERATSTLRTLLILTLILLAVALVLLVVLLTR